MKYPEWFGNELKHLIFINSFSIPLDFRIRRANVFFFNESELILVVNIYEVYIYAYAFEKNLFSFYLLKGRNLIFNRKKKVSTEMFSQKREI